MENFRKYDYLVYLCLKDSKKKSVCVGVSFLGFEPNREIFG